MLEFIRAATPAQRRTLANDLSASANYVVTRIPVGSAPKGLALSPDGKRLYVANRTDDTISVIDTASRKVSATLSLEGPATPTPERRGERLFFSARFAFQGHFGCANCHLESTFDGLQWDLEPDGFGKDIVDNRLLEDVAETAPFKWNGGNPEPRNRVRSAHREVLLSLGKLRRLGTGGPGELHQIDAAPPQPLPPGERRTDAGAGARQGDLRAHADEERHAHSASQPVPGVPFRAALHQPENVRRGQRQSRPTGRR